MSNESNSSYIEATVGRSPFAYIYWFFTPTVTIDGVKSRRPWGTYKFEVTPGEHEISFSYPWVFSPECGKATAKVNLVPGETRKVKYCAGLIRYLPGKITIE